jgi:hypothetical protein
MAQSTGILRVMLTDGDRQLSAWASQQDGVFTYAQALEAGLTVRQADWRALHLWERVHVGVFRIRGAPPTWTGDLRAASFAATPPCAVSHRAAAQMYDVPGGRNLVEITCRRWKRARRPGLVVHESTRLETVDITTIDAIPVVCPELMILELASLWPSVNFIERVIHAARRKRLITFQSTHETFDRLERRGLRGVGAVRIALDRWDPTAEPTESDMETLLLQILRDHGLPEPVTQFIVRDEAGRFIARTDLGIPQWHITIEYESTQEHSNELQLARDDRRRNAIAGAGYWPLSARYADLKAGGHQLVAEIRRIARRAEAG